MGHGMFQLTLRAHNVLVQLLQLVSTLARYQFLARLDLLL